MQQRAINLKKPDQQKTNWLISRQFIVIAVSIAVTTVGIKAADKFTNSPDSVDGCPAGMVAIVSATGNFCIDQYEASAGEDCSYESPQSEVQSKSNIDNNACKPVSAKGATPWRYISQNQAAIACARAGKRLATNAEWQQAALGTPDPQDNWTSEDCLVNGNWSSGQPGLTGSGSKCVSASGVYDMVGDVWEWTADTVYEGKFKDKELPDQGYVKAVDQDAMAAETAATPDANYYNDFFNIKKNGTRAVARGGYWGNKDQAGVYAAYIVSQPNYSEAGIGFRCVK